MKIHLIIEIEDDGKTRRATVERVVKVAELNGDGVLAINPAAALEIIKKQKRAKIADVAPPPIPPLPEPDAPKVRQSGSGPQFDPGFLKIIQDAPEPFTRRSLAVSSGLKVEDVTQRLIRLHKKGWIDQPAREMWRRTKTFGEKP
jgi:predicted Rossmann fold nucleotide-binding protein DprA/Smf involved in DNA uptake